MARPPYTIEADLIPFSITGVSPTNIGDNGQVTLTLHGARFQPGAAIALVGTAIYEPAKITLVDSGTVKARFQFTNAVRGQYDVVLTNPGGNFAAATNVVTIEEALPLRLVWPTARSIFCRASAHLSCEWLRRQHGQFGYPILDGFRHVEPGLADHLGLASRGPCLWDQLVWSACLPGQGCLTRHSLNFSFVVHPSESQDFIYHVALAARSRQDFVHPCGRTRGRTPRVPHQLNQRQHPACRHGGGFWQHPTPGGLLRRDAGHDGMLETNDLAFWPDLTNTNGPLALAFMAKPPPRIASAIVELHTTGTRTTSCSGLK